MTQYTIAWVHHDKGILDCFSAPFLNRDAVISHLTHAQQAIDELVKTKYDLIITDIRLAFLDMESIRDGKDITDRGLKEIFDSRSEGCNPDYINAGLRVIERIRERDSINRTTPVIATGLYDPYEDIVMNAKPLALAKGANDYVNLAHLGREHPLKRIALELLLDKRR